MLLEQVTALVARVQHRALQELQLPMQVAAVAVRMTGLVLAEQAVLAAVAQAVLMLLASMVLLVWAAVAEAEA